MPTLTTFARTAALIGDPGRAAMLWELMSGRALSAGELAGVAGIGNSTGSEHLAALRGAGLVTRIVNGRHHYYRLASAEVASLLETVMTLSAAAEANDEWPPRRVRCGPSDARLRRLRRCYNHLAGEIAVGIADAMIQRGQLCLSDEAAMLTPAGAAFLSTLGVALPRAESTHEGQGAAALCRPCLDWSERRYHLAGRIGALLYKALDQARWIRATTQGRALRLTPHGARELQRHFGIFAEAP